MKKKDIDVYKAISKILKTDEKKIIKSKNLRDIDEWDSLNHLAILIQLDKMFGNKVSKISKMKDADSIIKIIKLLRENNLIE